MSALLSVEGVSVSYWRGLHETRVLEDVSFDLLSGELAAVWGRRSTGKSTLAFVAAGLLAPQAGRVVFDGTELTNDRDQRLHAQIGLATRRGPEVEDLSIETWIASTLLRDCGWREAKRRAVRALADVGAKGLGGMRWSQLSDSERMLAGLAQAIVRRPRLVIADDPVAGLDSTIDRAEIMELLRGMAADGTTVLMMGSELSELHGAHPIWTLDRGRLEGPPRRQATVVPLRRSGDGG